MLALLREFRRMTTAMPDGAILLGPEPARSSGSTGRRGRWLDLRRKVDYGIRIDNLMRHPEFVEYLEKRRRRPRRRASTCPQHGDRWLAFRLVHYECLPGRSCCWCAT